MGFKKMLMDDFGKDLPIGDGFGQSVEDPILITTADPEVAALTRFEVVWCIFVVKEWYWRPLGQVFVDPENNRIEKFSVEVKYIEGDQIVTETRKFYFDLSEVKLQDGHQLPYPYVEIGAPINAKLPWKIGWFHFSGIINNEINDPGLGYTLAYSAPGAKMTVYAYDLGISDEIRLAPRDTAQREFVKVVNTFESLNPTAELLQEHEGDGFFVKEFLNGDELTVVFLAPCSGSFFKLRGTLPNSNESFLVDCMRNSILYFAGLMKRMASPNTGLSDRSVN